MQCYLINGHKREKDIKLYKRAKHFAGLGFGLFPIKLAGNLSN